MAVKKITTVFQFRRDTTENWLLNKDVIPAAGEPCFDLDLHMLKIGDGKTTYENLPEIGGASMSADGKSIVLSEGALQLAGFDTAEVGAQPRKNEDGFIEWVVPTAVDSESIENLSNAVEELQTDVGNLQSTVTTIQEIVEPSGDDAVPLLSRVETLEEKMDGTGEGSVDAKIDAKIEAFASNLTDDGKVNTLMELINYVESHGTEAANMAADISTLQELVGTTSVNDQILAIVNASGHMAETKAEAVFEHVKYEISHKPEGTLVDYRDKEIRVMVPADTKFEHQNSGTNANKNAYYMGFKAYAPEGTVSFKEDLAEIISDNTMYYFEDNDFAGIDAYGRKYSICWLAVAIYDEATQEWSIYGDQSSKDKYIGYYYSVEWYDVNGKMIGSDCIRINLTNEACHSAIEPYYMSGVIKEVAVNGTPLDVINGRVDITIPDQTIAVKASEEVTIAEDGTLGIGKISFSKIVQEEDEEVVFDGGSSAG